MAFDTGTNSAADRRAAMRDRLLDAAARVMVRQGYDGTTVRDILAEAAVAPNTLYAYFAGKEAILEALTDKVVEATEATIDAADDADVAALFNLLLRVALSTPFPAEALLTELRSRTTRGDVGVVRRITRAAVRATRPLVDRLRRDGALRAADPDALIELLDIIHDGMLRRAAGDTFVTSFARVGDVCLEVLAAGTLPGITDDGGPLTT
jgi:AcrR family transcriptional regulator